MEAEVERFLTGLAFSAKSQEEIEAITEQLEREKPTSDSTKSAKRLRTELKRLKDLYLLQDIEREEYMRERSRIQAELDALPSAASARKGAAASEVLRGLAQVWEMATPAEKKKLVREVVERVELSSTQIRVIAKPEYAPFFAENID